MKDTTDLGYERDDDGEGPSAAVTGRDASCCDSGGNRCSVLKGRNSGWFGFLLL